MVLKLNTLADRAKSFVLCVFLFIPSESYPDELCAASYQCLDVNSTCVNQMCVCDQGMYSNNTRCEMRTFLSITTLTTGLAVLVDLKSINHLFWNSVSINRLLFHPCGSVHTCIRFQTQYLHFVENDYNPNKIFTSKYTICTINLNTVIP